MMPAHGIPCYERHLLQVNQSGYPPRSGKLPVRVDQLQVVTYDDVGGTDGEYILHLYYQ